MKKIALIGVLVLVALGVLAVSMRSRLGELGRESLRAAGVRRACPYPGPETYNGWEKFAGSPVLGGGDQGVVFDVCAIKEQGSLVLYTSWRTKQSIGRSTSTDGFNWTDQEIALPSGPADAWDAHVNRPSVLKVGARYLMWYTGQDAALTRSSIGLAESSDGKNWTRKGLVMGASERWEKANVMCPEVLYDATAREFKMWYSAGDIYEPDAIGYATSLNGILWEKHPTNPIFRADPANPWESCRTTACCVLPYEDGYLMYYIGFRDDHNASIGLARSRNGINGWERHPQNPLIVHGRSQSAWDADAVYKPFVVSFKGRWLLFYNGRRDFIERIGIATKAGDDLWN